MQQPPERLTTPGQLLGTLQLAPCLYFSQNRKEREREREGEREGGRDGVSEPARTHKHINKDTFVEGSLEVKLPTIWTDGKAEVERIREEKGRRGKRKSDKKKMQVRESKVAKHCIFPMICGSGVEK